MRIRGWEFYVGIGLTTLAAAAVINAVFTAEWRFIMSQIGASIAVFAVTGASLIAYDGALARIRFDERTQEREKLRRRLVTLMKLQLASGDIRTSALRAGSKMEAHRNMSVGGSPNVYDAGAYTVERPKEFSDVVDNLDMISPDLTLEFSLLRYSLNTYESTLHSFSVINDLILKGKAEPDGLRGVLKNLIESASAMEERLAPLISNLTLEMKNN